MAVIKVYPSTVVEESSSGTVTWGDIDNVKLSDDANAVAQLVGGESTKNIKCTDFGLAIGSDKRVTGIKVGIEHTNSATKLPTTRNLYGKLVTGGVIQEEEKSDSLDIGTDNDVEITTELGGSTDKWSEALAISDVNATDFGVVIRLEMEAE